jgi:putative ABC transport system permease protein
MKILLKISWRNIWRNRKRSMVMIIAIAVGLWGGIFAAALMTGLLEQRFRLSIEQHISHIQIHHPDFLKDFNVKSKIGEWAELSPKLRSDEEIMAFSGRTKLTGMLASANLTRGVTIIGIDPEMEARTTGLDASILEGSYFGEAGRNPVLIGRKLAERMKIQERSRVVLTFQDVNNELVSATFRVAGIYQTSNSMYDEMHIYALQSDISEYSGKEIIVNEVAILAGDLDQVQSISERYKELFTGLSVRPWNEISPELSYMQEMAGMMMTIILIIILLALAFGLVNTMLMSVFERIRELGMLMSIGMNKKRVFGMIMLETIFLTFLGAMAGVVLGIISLTSLGRSGLNLAAVGGDSLEQFGFSAVVYPHLEPSFFIVLTLLVIITAFITSIYPALKALRLKPAEAVRHE